jgi:hypothetical protein
MAKKPETGQKLVVTVKAVEDKGEFVLINATNGTAFKVPPQLFEQRPGISAKTTITVTVEMADLAKLGSEPVPVTDLTGPVKIQSGSGVQTREK